MALIDFTNLELKKKTYGGANGNKISVVYNGELYMLKLPTHADKNTNLSYANSSVSEYLGCEIFRMLGMEAQQTVLGKFTHNGIERIAVLCKDFERNGYVLKDFASVKNQIIDSGSNGYGTELKDIVETIEKQTVVDPIELSEHFWNMFVIDAVIGNWDRHNGNWGFLYNQDTDTVKIAPIYDCGSCLFPQLDDDKIHIILNDRQQFNARIYDFPTSAVLNKGRRINYYSFIKSHEYKECDEAIKRIKSRVNIDDIFNLIDSVECISPVKKEFIKRILSSRIAVLLGN